MTGMTPGKITTAAMTLNDSVVKEVAIADGVTAYFTSRGDVTDSPYSGFNVCHYTGDNPENVARCRRWLSNRAGVSRDAFIVPRQTHSVNCLVIDSIPVAPDILENVDALVTSLRGVAIGVSTADCVPVLLADPLNGVIAAAHAGWRGAIGGIVEETLAKMTRLGADALLMKVAIGPCICKECFEVGEEVAGRFPDEYVIRTTGCKPHVDLPGYVASRLIAGGVLPDNIIMPFACTRCEPDRYFSARALGINSGRNFSAIVMK